MNKQTLDKLRFIIPGIMISVTIYFVMNGIEGTIKNPLDNYLFYLLSLFFSVLYYAFNIRDIIWRKIDNTFFMKYISLCFEKIKNDEEIPVPCFSCLLKTKKETVNFRKNRRLFFELIDTQEILKEKSYQIMLNGCILTSVIDLGIVTFGVVIVEMVLYFLKQNFDLTMLIVCSVFVLSTPIVVYRLIKKHLQLTQGQMKSVKKEWFYE